MDADELDICNYLKTWARQFISGREICRRAGGKHRFRDDPYWANQPLMRLVEKGLIETDSAGHYRLIQKQKEQPRKWVSPHLKEILEKSGKEFGTIEPDKPEDLPG